MSQAALIVMMVGIAGGLAVGLQSPMANFISIKLGVLESIFIVHLGGAIIAAIPLLVMRGGKMGEWKTLPWYMLATGAWGLVLIGTISYTIPRIGVSAAIVLVVAGQLTMAVIVDHFGLMGADVRPVEPVRLFGIAIVMLGVWIIVR